ncbi:MAG: ornithine carbamoyltransferase [Caldimicrobium thiodismutans]|uniref:Ornithine carbamoyltransferase n=1 Tax=Caldimicrobium thiodismutans TaxID=1653476 RepID=A0A2N7PKM2_9BACT|nr:MAG: ornithine carbamoyltransferase [Caldimicrobium thiodismutans]
MAVRHFLRIWDFTKEEVETLIEKALKIKKTKTWERSLQGKILALIFEKASTRTRVSFESAMIKLGGHTLFLSRNDLQLARGEPIKDTARVLSRYVDGVVLRTYLQETIEEFAEYSQIPVINGLSNRFHPCQVLSDIMTVIEKGKDLYKSKIIWLGDGNNVAQSWIEASALLGFPLILCCPEGFDPEEELLREARERFQAKIEIVRSPEEALTDAEVINTDVWISMGQEEESERRIKAFRGFTLDYNLLKRAKPSAIVLHCLPAHRGEEITEEVLEGPQSVVWDQAENKMWFHMALLDYILKGA